jgi:hypothetical protein
VARGAAVQAGRGRRVGALEQESITSDAPASLTRATRPVFRAFARGRVAVLIWHQAIVAEGVPALSAVFEELRREHGADGFGFLTIIEKDTDVHTPAAVRDGLSQLLASSGPWLRAAAIAYEATGFKATIIRSAITAINIASRARFPNRVFQRTEAALEWLTEHVGTLDPELTQELQYALRRR